MADDQDNEPLPPSLSSDYAEPGSPQHSFRLYLHQARSHSERAGAAHPGAAAAAIRDAEQLYQRAITYAQEWQMREDVILASRELSSLYLRAGKYSHSLDELVKLAVWQTKSFGPNHESLALTYKNMGICHAGLRHLDEAIEHLRDAVVRYQTTDGDVRDDLLDTLCVLSNVYRQRGRVDRARVCIRQAFSISEGDQTPVELQVRVLEELAAVMFAQHKVRSAITAYLRVLQLKQEAFGTYGLPCAATMIAIGMCHVEQHNYGQAEAAFVPALEVLHRSGGDRRTIGDTLLKLAGVLRSQGRFIEANIIEQGAGEIIGRAVDQGLGFFKQFESGRAAHRRGHLDVAQSCYRQALRDLEWTFDKQSAVRVPILCCLHEIAEERGQKVQAKSFAVEIDECVGALFGQQNKTTLEGLLQLARLFRLLSYNGLSDSLYRHVELRKRKSRDADLIDLLSERSELLARIGTPQERRQIETLVRRLRRLTASGDASLHNGDDLDSVVDAIVVAEFGSAENDD